MIDKEPTNSLAIASGLPGEVPTVALTVHPLLSSLPEWADDDPQFEAFCRDIHGRGLDYPIKISRTHQIVDGRHRWRAAKRLQLPTVPVSIVSDDQIFPLVISSIAQRRHYPKGALCYICAPIIRSNHIPGASRPIETLVAESGFSFSLFRQAEKLREIFTENGEDGEAFRAEIEPKILSGEIGLGAAIAGWAGRVATKGVSKQSRNTIELLDRSFTDLSKRFSSWEKLDPGTQATALARVSIFAESLPAALLQGMLKKFHSELKRREKEAQ